MNSSRMHTAHTVTVGGCVGGGGGGVSAQGGVCPRGGCLSRGDVCLGVSAQGDVCWEGCHVTYPIMHLMLPVCCPNTN